MHGDMIRILGAREHNLRALDVDLPRGCLIAVCGVSGSGKTSLALDTLHAEGQRRYLEALAASGPARGLAMRRPAVDAIEGLPPTIALTQHAADPSARSSAGTLLDALPALRVLLSRAGTQHCPRCGDPITPLTHDQIVDALASLPPGTRATIEAPVEARGQAAAHAVLDEVVRAGFSRVRVDGRVVRIDDLATTAQLDADQVRVVVDRIKIRPDGRDRLHDAVRTAAHAGRGAIVVVAGDEERHFVDRPYCARDRLELPRPEPALLTRRGAGACSACGGRGELDGGERCDDCEGSGLGAAARAIRFDGANLADLCALSMSALRARAGSWSPTAISAAPIADLIRRLELAAALGLGALPLARAATTMSSGELQRIRLVRHVASRLSGLLFVLDEPTAGLDDALATTAMRLARDLVDQGNTVLVVEHSPIALAAADLVLELGPAAGREGGEIVYRGTAAGLREADTWTGRWLSGAARLEARPAPTSRGVVTVRGLTFRALAGVDVELPLAGITAIAGPSGAGKTTLLDALCALVAVDGDDRPAVRDLAGADALTRITDVGRSSRGGSARSIVASYVGLWDVMRELLAATREARVRGLDAALFSLNRAGGRCEACRGQGEQRVDMHVLPDVFVPCDVCGGRRFRGDLLEVRWKGLDPSEILAARAADALRMLAGHPKLEVPLRALVDVGLGYVPLGQPGHTWSGGERQRLRIARELVRASRRDGMAGTLIALDDPTVGLHPQDVHGLLELLRRLSDEGATVWLTTHDQGVAAVADHRIDLSPDPVDRSVDNVSR